MAHRWHSACSPSTNAPPSKGATSKLYAAEPGIVGAPTTVVQRTAPVPSGPPLLGRDGEAGTWKGAGKVHDACCTDMCMSIRQLQPGDMPSFGLRSWHHKCNLAARPPAITPCCQHPAMSCYLHEQLVACAWVVGRRQGRPQLANRQPAVVGQHPDAKECIFAELAPRPEVGTGVRWGLGVGEGAAHCAQCSIQAALCAWLPRHAASLAVQLRPGLNGPQCAARAQTTSLEESTAAGTKLTSRRRGCGTLQGDSATAGSSARRSRLARKKQHFRAESSRGTHCCRRLCSV